MTDSIPFRWNVKKKSELGSLLQADFSMDTSFIDCTRDYNDIYYQELRECTVNILSSSEGANLCFVGRSLDNVYDYLSGLFEHTFRQDTICCLNISLWGKSIEVIAKENSQAIQVLKNHYQALKIDPKSIISKGKPTCFVDVVHEGGTYEEIYYFLLNWTKELKLPIKNLNQKLRFVGVTSRTKNSPNTWRWQQQSEWTKNLKSSQVKNISVDRHFWRLIADIQNKMSPSNQPHKWHSDELKSPTHNKSQITAIKQAYYLFNQATTKQERLAFLKVLHANTTANKQDWIRSLSLEIKSSGM